MTDRLNRRQIILRSAWLTGAALILAGGLVTGLRMDRRLNVDSVAPGAIGAVLDFDAAAPDVAPWGAFPPTEPLTRDEAAARGVLLPPEPIDGFASDTRLSPDGVFITQLGDTLFLSQSPREESVYWWHLRVPPDVTGTLRLLAADIRGQPSLGVERPGEFSRVSWKELGRFFVLVDFGGMSLDQLVMVARSIR